MDTMEQSRGTHIGFYDIFRRDAGGPVWVDARLYVENARARIQELAALSPGNCFFIYDTQNSALIFELSIGNTVSEKSINEPPSPKNFRFRSVTSSPQSPEP
jgi:hypothetical protein